MASCVPELQSLPSARPYSVGAEPESTVHIHVHDNKYVRIQVHICTCSQPRELWFSIFPCTCDVQLYMRTCMYMYIVN